MNGAYGAESAVGRRRTTETHDDALGTEVECFVDQFSGAGRGCGDRVVQFGPPGEGESGGAGHLDDCCAAVEPPFGLDRVTEWTGDRGRAVGSSESLECSFAAIGESQLDAVVAEFPAGVTDRFRDGRGRCGALEFVDRGHDLHVLSLALALLFDFERIAEGRPGRNIVSRRVGGIVGVVVSLVAVAGVSACGGGDSEPSGDQVAAAETYIRIYSPSNPECVLKEHKKVDDEMATLLLQAYEAYETYDYDAEDAAYTAIGDEAMVELTKALNKCALG